MEGVGGVGGVTAREALPAWAACIAGCVRLLTPAVASPEGQVSDWGLSFADGSRIHVHQFADGRYVVDRDR